MRTIPLILTVALLAAALSTAWWARAKSRNVDEEVADARIALHALQREVRIRSAMDGAVLNGRGWPMTIDPDWFRDENRQPVPPPSNPLVPFDRPWLEIASNLEADLLEPPIRQSVDRNTAAFWYNPTNGVVRARVGPNVNDRAAIDLYNRINGSKVAVLFNPAWDAEKLLREQAELLKQQRAQQDQPKPVIVVRRADEPPTRPQTLGSADEKQ